MNGRQRRILAWVTLADLAAVVGGPVLAQVTDSDVAQQCAIGVVAVASFVGFLTFHMAGEDRQSADSVMRPTIAATFVLVFLALVSVTAFFTSETEEVASPIASNLLSNFATLTGVVVAFYFGASAFERAFGGRERSTSTREAPEERDVLTHSENRDSQPGCVDDRA